MSTLSLQENKPERQLSYFHLKDPVSAITHGIAAVASVIGTPILLIHASNNNASTLTLLSLAIYGLSMTMLYCASTIYHALYLPEKQTTILKKVDHMSIFVLIAGSYTPVCLSLLHNTSGYVMFVVIWALALLGIVLKAFWVYCPKYVSSIIYIGMGWTALFSIRSIYAALTPLGFFWLLLGGILYTAGGVLYSFNIKINEQWGSHEIFHLFVMAGSLCHYIMMFFFIA